MTPHGAYVTTILHSTIESNDEVLQLNLAGARYNFRSLPEIFQTQKHASICVFVNVFANHSIQQNTISTFYFINHCKSNWCSGVVTHIERDDVSPYDMTDASFCFLFDFQSKYNDLGNEYIY